MTKYFRLPIVVMKVYSSLERIYVICVSSMKVSMGVSMFAAATGAAWGG